MTTTLNNYTINDFVKIEPVIFEYCINLTQKKRETFWCRDLADAKELYQEVFLYVHDNYFNKPKEPTYEGKFIQMMKNCTYWTFHRRITSANSRIYRSLNRIDDSPKDFFMFEQANYEPAKIHLDFKKSIDYQYYIKTLKPIEVKAIELYLQGYAIKEIDEICNKPRGFLDNLIRVKLSKIAKKDIVKKPKPVKSLVDRTRTVKNLKEDDIDFLKSKINNFDIIFKSKNTKNIKLYSLYLQGVSMTEISEIFKISKGQIGVELFRIKERIRKYDIR
jgi:DNA-directed RNA polymerase specialized sigma24 family protein